MLSAGSGSSHLRGRSLPTGQMPAPPAPAARHHLQLLIILICKVEEPGHVEEELSGILQQQQDQAQATEAVENRQASISQGCNAGLFSILLYLCRKSSGFSSTVPPLGIFSSGLGRRLEELLCMQEPWFDP